MTENENFIPQQGYYRNLRVYKVAEIVYDITYFFAGRFLAKGSEPFELFELFEPFELFELSTRN